MKGDIESQKDLEFLVDSFYEKVRENEEIGHYF
jgi:truncated hemoglobin YjbI